MQIVLNKIVFLTSLKNKWQWQHFIYRTRTFVMANSDFHLQFQGKLLHFTTLIRNIFTVNRIFEFYYYFSEFDDDTTVAIDDTIKSRKQRRTESNFLEDETSNRLKDDDKTEVTLHENTLKSN